MTRECLASKHTPILISIHILGAVILTHREVKMGKIHIVALLIFVSHVFSQ